MTLEPPAPPAFSDLEPSRPPQWRGAFASLGIGVAAALLGLLPWMLTGMRLPLQNLWAFEMLPEQMPVALLPFSQYTVTTVMGMMVVAWVAAGIAARALAARLPSRAPLAIAAGVLLVQIIAIAQSAEAVSRGLRGGGEASFYLGSCIAVAVAGIVFGILAFALVARAPRGGAVIGLVLGALALDWWIGAFFWPNGVLPIELYSSFRIVLRWVPAVLVGAAIAWGDVRTPGRIVAGVVSLLLLWLVPALATAVSSAVGSRVLLRAPLEMLDYGWGVLRSALFMPELALPPLVVAVVVAAAGIGLREVLVRRAV